MKRPSVPFIRFHPADRLIFIALKLVILFCLLYTMYFLGDVTKELAFVSTFFLCILASITSIPTLEIARWEKYTKYLERIQKDYEHPETQDEDS